MNSLYVYILAGGSGERFWPLSRRETPKHLLRLFSEKTLLEETVSRLRQLVPSANLTILTNQAQSNAIKKLLADDPDISVVAEPAKRDTAPAATLAHALTLRRDPQGITALLPADHIIHDTARFQHALEDAAHASTRHDAILTLAIPPTHPSEGFGYLELGPQIPPGTHGTAFNQVLRFVEKPNRQTALAYVESGKFAWNAGMFLWRTDWFQKELERLQPELARFAASFPTGNFESYLAEEFPQLPKISVDYAIMEKTSHVIAARASFDWDDVGSWTALPSHLPKDSHGNTLKGKTATIDSTGNIVFSTSRRIALCGVQDLVVVETPDAILVCHRDQVQKIKALLPQLDEAEL